jgi:hypothetical protein
MKYLKWGSLAFFVALIAVGAFNYEKVIIIGKVNSLENSIEDILSDKEEIENIKADTSLLKSERVEKIKKINTLTAYVELSKFDPENRCQYLKDAILVIDNPAISEAITKTSSFRFPNCLDDQAWYKKVRTYSKEHTENIIQKLKDKGLKAADSDLVEKLENIFKS